MKNMEKFLTKPYVVVIGAIMCCLLWGSAFPCVKLGYSLFAVDTSHTPSLMLFAGLRFTLAGVFVIGFSCITQKKFVAPKPKNLWCIAVLCLFQTVGQYVCFYVGLANTSGVKSAIFNGLGVFFTILSACFIFRTEKFNLIKLAGCLLGFAGVVLVNFGGDFSFQFTFMGEGFLTISGICAALAIGFTKIFSKRENTAVLCGYQFFLGGLSLVIIGLSFGGNVAPVGFLPYLMLVYLAFIASFAFTLQSYLMKYNPISKVAVYKSTNPLFGAVFSALILGEGDKLLSIFTLIAVLCVCAGIFIINKFGERKKAPAEAPPPECAQEAPSNSQTNQQNE